MPDAPRATSADRRLAALFPDESAGSTPTQWWRRRGGRVAIVAVVVAVLLGGLVAANAFGSSGGDYRTASAAIEDVDARQTGVATIEPVAQATVAFPVSGTVASVNVQVGQSVAAGGTLASLDTQALVQTLHAKQASLAQAQLTLSKALSGQSVGGIGSGGAGGSSSPSGATLSAFRTGGPSRIVLTAAQTGTPLQAAQQAVLDAQHQVDAALAAAATALNGETTVCAPFTSSTAPAPTPASPPDVTACQQAITAVTNAQNAVAAAQKALAAASSALEALLAQQATAPPPTTAPSGAATSGGAGSSGSGASRSGSGGSGTSSSPSAADLVAYQQSVDAAAAAAAVAQQAVDQATIASPLAGTVVAVDMKVGDSVGADSSTENVVVQGAGGYEVTTTVSVDNIPSVSVGQAATVTPDGEHSALAGKVVAISVAPVASSTTSTLYRVTIGLTNPGAKLNNGATGTVSIVTRHARSALAVPTSAVTSTRNRHFVRVVQGGSVTTVPVDVGVVGTTWTEITHGLSKGQQVMLADKSAALPSSATASTGSTSGTSPFGRFGGFGGFGGGGGGAGRTGTRGG